MNARQENQLLYFLSIINEWLLAGLGRGENCDVGGPWQAVVVSMSETGQRSGPAMQGDNSPARGSGEPAGPKSAIPPLSGVTVAGSCDSNLNQSEKVGSSVALAAP